MVLTGSLVVTVLINVYIQRMRPSPHLHWLLRELGAQRLQQVRRVLHMAVKI